MKRNQTLFLQHTWYILTTQEDSKIQDFLGPHFWGRCGGWQGPAPLRPLSANLSMQA